MGSYALDRQDNTVAVMLEVLPGAFLQLFGLGHIYQGRVGLGLFIMISYWMIQSVNVFLMFFLLGFLTAPLTWLFYLVAAPLNANDHRR